MAQSPTNLQEPSMDELLASIREIIEENSAAVETGESASGAPLENGGAGEILTMNFDRSGGSDRGGSFNKDGGERGNFDGRQERATQEDAIAHAALPIHDAMKALAARIGLKKQAAEPDKTPIQSTPFAFNPVTSSPASTVVRPFPSGQIAVGSLQKTPAAATARSHPPTAAAVPSPSKSSSPTARAPIPLSLSAQASTHSASTHAASASNLHSLKRHLKPQTDSQIESQAKVSQAKLSSTASLPANAPLPAGHIPLYPQFHAMPASPHQPPLDQPSPKPPETVRASAQGEASGSRRQAGNENNETSAPKSTDPNLALSEPSIASKPESVTNKPEDKLEEKRELNAFEQGFLAEFEQSAELLLRPYIAAWLEEHFQNLFEKILREEIQRLMQKNLQR